MKITITLKSGGTTREIEFRDVLNTTLIQTDNTIEISAHTDTDFIVDEFELDYFDSIKIEK